MKGKPKWATGLPTAEGRWGLGDVYEMYTHVVVRPKGSHEEDIFIRTVLFYKSLYLDLSPRFEMDRDNVVKGPVFAKCDSGPGGNCESPRAIKFRRNMHREGFTSGPVYRMRQVCRKNRTTSSNNSRAKRTLRQKKSSQGRHVSGKDS